MRASRLLAKELAIRRPKIKLSTGPPVGLRHNPPPCPAPDLHGGICCPSNPPWTLHRFRYPPPHTTPALPLSLLKLPRLPPPPVTTQTPGDNTWSTDRLIQAWRQGGERSQALKAALRALRPPDRPTGRFLVLLQGSDGTIKKIWLPPVE
ncbi:hypothetical protein JTB14_010227 [Gonioctena quinquepunctata]|nr:hypothetical protein JTB14_010227 [Gonioctena quinquepunctata]